ncbi:MAG: SDR family NAD(P)-dependent oxidoreductase [Cyclobacteriaceae bacterium]
METKYLPKFTILNHYNHGTNIFTGSADGLGQLAAQQLVHDGHQVVLHARNKSRGQEALAKVPGAETVLIGDLSDIAQTKQLATIVNAAIILLPSFTMQGYTNPRVN